MLCSGEPFERVPQLGVIDAALGVEAHASVRICQRQRVVIAEAIGNQRDEAAAPRRGRERPA